MSQPLLINPQKGSKLMEVVKHLSQAKIDRFGSVSGGVGAIHLDSEFGRKTRFQSTLAHGYLILGYISEMMKNNFGKPWFLSGSMETKLVGPAKPGDTIVVGGHVSEMIHESDKTVITCEIWVDNHLGSKVAVGHAVLLMERKSPTKLESGEDV